MPKTPENSRPAMNILTTFIVMAYFSPMWYRATMTARLAMPSFMPGMAGLKGIRTSMYEKMRASAASSAVIVNFFVSVVFSISSPCYSIILACPAGDFQDNLIGQTYDAFACLGYGALMYAVLPLTVGKTH